MEYKDIRIYNQIPLVYVIFYRNLELLYDKPGIRLVEKKVKGRKTKGMNNVPLFGSQERRFV